MYSLKGPKRDMFVATYKIAILEMYTYKYSEGEQKQWP